MRVLLVDDERLARARMRKLLRAHEHIEVVAEADSVDRAHAAILAHAPELVFLDISMPGESGFELLTRMRVDAHIIFVTAHDQHAISAFEVGAIDYLLKPVEAHRLAQAIERVRSRTTPPTDRLQLKQGRRVLLVRTGDILMVRAKGDYSEFLLRDGSRVEQHHPLGHWEKRLGNGFFRVHRSTIVSLVDVERVERAAGSSSQLYLRHLEEAIPVSRSRVKALKVRLG